MTVELLMLPSSCAWQMGAVLPEAGTLLLLPFRFRFLSFDCRYETNWELLNPV